jgi:hypothetical protein
VRLSEGGGPAPEPAAVARLAALARVESARGSHRAAGALLGRAAALAERIFGPDHPSTVVLRAGDTDGALPLEVFI